MILIFKPSTICNELKYLVYQYLCIFIQNISGNLNTIKKLLDTMLLVVNKNYKGRIFKLIFII